MVQFGSRKICVPMPLSAMITKEELVKQITEWTDKVEEPPAAPATEELGPLYEHLTGNNLLNHGT